MIGTLLGLPSQGLDIIEHDNHFKAIPCCNAMLKLWLQTDTTASWGKLFDAIHSASIKAKGDYIASHYVAM